MMYKNTFRLFFSNANSIWKTLLYCVILALLIGAGTLACYPLVVRIYRSPVFDGIFEICTNLFRMWENNTLGITILNVINNLVTIAFSRDMIIYTVALMCIVILSRYILFGIYTYSMSDNLYSYMTSGYKKSYTVSLFSTIKCGTLLGLSKLVISFPIDIIITCVLYFCIKMFTLGGLYAIFAPFIICIVFTLLYSLKLSLFSSWECAICTHNSSIFGGLVRGIKVSTRRYFRVLGSAFALIITLLAVNVFACLFTAGSCLIITIPSSILLVSIFGNVVYFSGHGMRFYVEDNYVVSPKRLDASENVNNTKYML